jgi:hypothetical protein
MTESHELQHVREAVCCQTGQPERLAHQAQQEPGLESLIGRFLLSRPLLHDRRCRVGEGRPEGGSDGDDVSEMSHS